jgi:hypothetical protein
VKVKPFIQNRKPDPQGRSKFNGFAGKDCELFLEYWSIGVLECWKKRKLEFQLE